MVDDATRDSIMGKCHHSMESNPSCQLLLRASVWKRFGTFGYGLDCRNRFLVLDVLPIQWTLPSDDHVIVLHHHSRPTSGLPDIVRLDLLLYHPVSNVPT